jgi:hypothetical protein
VVAWNAQIRGHVYLRIDVRRGGPSGHLGGVQSLGEGDSPEASIAPDGTAVVMWDGVARPGHGRRLLLASIAPPGMPFGRPQTLLLVKANVPNFSVVATDERIVAVWGQGIPHGQPAVRYATAAGNHLFGPDETVGPSFDEALDGAGADAAGDLIVTYDAGSPRSSEAPHAAMAVMPVGASSFRAPETLLPSPLDENLYTQDGTSLGDGPGGIAVGLETGDETNSNPLKSNLFSATLGPGLSFLAPVAVGTVLDPAPYLTTHTDPVFALPEDGGQAAAWVVGRILSADTESPATGSLMVSSEQPDGVFSAPVPLSLPSTISQYPVAAATDDTAIIAWGEGEFDKEHLVYSLRSAGDSFTAPRGLSRGVLRQPSVAGAGEHAAIAWIAGTRLQMAVLTG